MTEHIRRAAPGDEADITAMIHELAEFERAAEECTVTETHIRTALFGERPIAYAHVVEVDGAIAATALWFLNFSTWPRFFAETCVWQGVVKRKCLSCKE